MILNKMHFFIFLNSISLEDVYKNLYYELLSQIQKTEVPIHI